VSEFYSNRETSRWLKFLADLYTEESSPFDGDVNAPLTGTVHAVARPSPSAGALPDANLSQFAPLRPV